jgi:hypothetical protein
MNSWTLRYAWLKVVQAYQSGSAVLQDLTHKGYLNDKGQAQSEELYSKASDLVKKAVMDSALQPLTRIIRVTGPAMMPTLNRQASKDPTAQEFLLTRKVPRPAPDTVRNGDVVCFKHPLGNPGGALMVRRVAASGGEVLHSDVDEHLLAPDVVWVVADNEKLEPPHVEDSRSFGPVPLSNIVGRCIYAIRNRADREHILNHCSWKAQDEEVVRVELTDDVLDELEPSLSTAGKN